MIAANYPFVRLIDWPLVALCVVGMGWAASPARFSSKVSARPHSDSRNTIFTTAYML